MTCPSEFTCSLYADGELNEVESREVRVHVECCSRCLRLVEALIEENRILTRVLQDDSPSAACPVAGSSVSEPAYGASLLWASVLVIAAVLRIPIAALAALPSGAAFEWLNPLHTSGQMTYAIGIFFALAERMPSAIAAVNSAGLALINLVVITLLLQIFRRYAVRSITLAAVMLVTIGTSHSYATDVRTGGRVITLAAGETLDDTLIAAGQTVIIDGEVTGDVLAFARTVRVNGAIRGNLIAMAQSVEVAGSVGGSVFGFAQTVEIGGPVQQNLYAFAQTLRVDPASTVGSNVIVFAASTDLGGTVTRDLTSFSATADVYGNVGRHMDAHAERITIHPEGAIGGNLTAHVPASQNVEVMPGATVGGEQTVDIEERRPTYTSAGFYIRQILGLIAAFVTGLVLFWLFPALEDVRLDTGIALLRSGGIGALAAVVIPIVAVIVAITLIGLPLALVTLAAWLLGLYLGKIVIAGFVGRALLGTPSRAIALLAGLLLIYVAINLPFIGGLINLLLTVIGFGTILWIGYNRFRPVHA